MRSNKIIHRSQEQQHYFNSPYQIAILPPPKARSATAAATASSTAASNHVTSSSSSAGRQGVDDNSDDETLISDSPEAAITSSLELKEGDFIVMGTDGLWDNLNESHLLVEISNIKVILEI